MKFDKFIKYISASGLLILTLGLQSCKDDEIHEVFSGTDYSLTLQSGEIVNSADVIKDKDLGRFFSSDDDVVEYEWTDERIYALEPGIAVLRNSECTVGVRVLPYEGPAIFPELPEFDTYSINEESIKQYMEKNGFNLTEETNVTVDGRKAIALKYAPFGNSESITFYVITQSWYYSCKATIVTGKSVADNRGFLLRDYSLSSNSNHISNRYFVKKGGGSFYINTDDDWKTLRVEYQ